MDNGVFARLDLMEVYLSSLQKIQNNLTQEFYLLRRDFINVGNWDDATFEKTQNVISVLKTKLYDLFIAFKELTDTFDLYIEDLQEYNDTSKGKFGRL